MQFIFEDKLKSLFMVDTCDVLIECKVNTLL